MKINTETWRNKPRKAAAIADPAQLMKVRNVMHITSMSRTLIYQLIEEKAFKAIYFKSRRDQTRGVWLIDRESFFRWLEGMRGNDRPALQSAPEAEAY